jgi:hypothetical protein
MENNSVISRIAHPHLLYQPLRSENREIRLLRINSSQPDVFDIHCSLENVSLNAMPTYEALSYEWGLPDVNDHCSRVLLNSHVVPTTPNLRLALNRLPPERCYWIDALCINQRDDNERGLQVRLMTEIYRHASAVVVWLGLEEGNSKHGMYFLNEAGTFLQNSKDASDPGLAFRDWLHSALSRYEL